MSITPCNVALIAVIVKTTLLSESVKISSAEDCLVVGVTNNTPFLKQNNRHVLYNMSITS